MAQVNVQNNGIAFVSAPGTFFINGSLTNATGAALTNNGGLYVSQNITNSEVAMATGTGTLYLNGTAMQTIAGSQMFKTYNLVTNNTAGFTLNNNLSASGVHTYTNGIITTSATPNYLVYEAGASYTGDNDARHVDGWVKKLGNSNFIFPVGNVTYERTIALNSLAASSEFNVRHYDAPTPNYTSLFSPLVLVDTSEYWTINRISGGSAVVDMNWDNAKIPVPQVTVTSIRAAYYDGTFWTSIGGTGTGSVTTTGGVTSNSVSAFNNNFTIGSTAFLLPLNLISFTGAKASSYNRLSWVMGNELNALQYELQRSDDAINFNTINRQNPKNYGGTVAYSYDDVAAIKGKVYYRLHYTDNGGQSKYSSIVVIAASQSDNKDFYVIKNPVSDKIDIYAGDQIKGAYNYTLANNAGQIVQTGVLDIKTQGVYTIKLQSYLPAGIYILVLRNGTTILQKTILKE